MMTPCGTTPARVMVALVLTLMVGCAPYVSRYRYISLEKVSGIEITETVQPELAREEIVEGAYFIKPIPIGYLLQRPAYVLRIRVPPKALEPVLIFRIEARDRSKLKMTEFIPVAKKGMGHSGIRYDGVVKEDEFIFSWLPGPILAADGSTTWVPRPLLAAEGPTKIHVDGRLEILFEVVNDLGEIIAKESLPFEIKSNGFFWVWDGL